MGSNNRVGNIEGNICPFQEKDIVLDAGTGLGHLLCELSPRCSQIYAIDTNLYFLKRVRSRIREANIVLLQADVGRTPFRPSHFTKLICTEVLEHLPEPLLAIEEFYKLLKPGGICVIAVPTRLSERLYSILNQDYNQNEQEHVTILKKSQWISLFRKAGFEIITVKNENFQPALYWIFRNVFQIRYDPSSGLVLEKRLFDRIFWRVAWLLNIFTLGGFDRLGNKIFPKSWYFYLRKSQESGDNK